MIGAIMGDIIGSRFEWHNVKSKEFTLLKQECTPTDDSLMTLAIAEAILEAQGDWSKLEALAIENMQYIGGKYPDAGYGSRFGAWLISSNPTPYYSYGNGSAMRVSPVAYAGNSIEEVIDLSTIVTRVTHNHPEGMKGAEAVAVAIYLARIGSSIDEIKCYLQDHYYPLAFSLDEIRDKYIFFVDCQRSVPVAIMCFLESTSYEDAIRNAISLGGDSDTIAAIAGSIAEAYYGVSDELRRALPDYLDSFMMKIVDDFETKYPDSKKTC